MPENTRPLTQQVAAWADRRRWIIAGCVLALYLLGYNGQWRPLPDSAEYLTAAQRLLDGEPFQYGLQQVGVGMVYLLMLLGQPSGHVNFALSQAAMVALALGGLAAAFLLLRHHLGRPPAVLLTALLALTETYYSHAFYLLADMPFCFGLLVLLLGWAWADRDRRTLTTPAQRRAAAAGWALVAGGMLVMAVFRSVSLTVLVGVAMTVAWRMAHRRDAVRAGGLGAVTLAAWIMGRLATPGTVNRDEMVVVHRLFANLPDTLQRMVRSNLPALVTESAAEAVVAVDFGPIIGVGVLVLVVAAWVRVLRFNALWGLITAAFMLQWLLFMPSSRYFLPVLLPLVAGWWLLVESIEARRPNQTGRWIALAMLVLWFGPNIVLVGRMVVQQRRVPYLEHLQDGRFLRLEALGRRLAELEPGAAIIASEGPLLTWYSGRPVTTPKLIRKEVSDATSTEDLRHWLSPYQHIYVVRPYNTKHQAVMRRMPLELGGVAFTSPRGEGQSPWTVRRAQLLPSPVQPDHPDRQQNQNPQGEHP